MASGAGFHIRIRALIPEGYDPTRGSGSCSRTEMMKWVHVCLKTVVGFAIALAISGRAMAARDYSPHTGYLPNVQGERDIKYSDLELLPPLPEAQSLTDRIFNESLSKEFRDKYYEKFGRTEIERIYLAPNRTTYYNDVYGLKGSPQEINDERKKFGDYMIRRLAEVHVDDYLKNDPKARPIYEAKQAISNIQVAVQQFRFDLQYGLAGNTFDFIVINPYLATSKVRLEMDEASFGPGPVNETLVTLGNPVTKTIDVEARWATNDGIASLVGRKTLTPALTTSLTLSTFTKDEGPSTRESLYLAGVGYTF